MTPTGMILRDVQGYIDSYRLDDMSGLGIKAIQCNFENLEADIQGINSRQNVSSSGHDNLIVEAVGRISTQINFLIPFLKTFKSNDEGINKVRECYAKVIELYQVELARAWHDNNPASSPLDIGSEAYAESIKDIRESNNNNTTQVGTMATSLELIREARRIIVQDRLGLHNGLGIDSIQASYESIEQRVAACRSRIPNSLLVDEKADLGNIRNFLSGQKLILFPLLGAHLHIAGIDKIKKCYEEITTKYENELSFLDNPRNIPINRQNSAPNLQGRAAPLLDNQTISLNLPISYTEDRLNEGAIEIGMRIGLVAAEKAAGAALPGAKGGAYVGMAYVAIVGGRKVYQGGMSAVQLAIGNPVPVLLFAAKEIGEFAAQGAAYSMAANALVSAYNASAYEYSIRVNPKDIGKFAESANACRALIQAYVDDPQFMDLSATAELIDPISLGVIIFPVKTPCNHIFEKNEITTWIQEGKQNCPLCRCDVAGIDKLQFSWMTYLKIIKMVRGIMHWVNQNPPRLPPRLVSRSVTQIKQILTNVDKFSDEQLNLVSKNITEALREGRKKGSISEDNYDASIAELKKWEKF